MPGLLLLLALATGYAAFLIYPSRPALLSPPGLAVSLFVPVDVEVEGLDVAVDTAQPRRYKITTHVWLLSRSDRSPGAFYANVMLVLARAAVVEDCAAPACEDVTNKDDPTSPRTIRLKSAPGAGEGVARDIGGTRWVGQASVEVAAERSLVTENGVELNLRLPTLQLYSAGAPVQANLQYQLPTPSASWDWIGDPQPSSIDETARFIRWSETLTPEGTNTSLLGARSVLVTAIDRAAQARDAQLTFFAGVLAGVAGGALVSGLQELLHMHPSAKATAAGGQ